MDIASMSMINSTAKLQTAVGTSMLSKSISAGKQQGQAIAQMIASASPQQMALSVNPSVGSNFDLKV